MSPPSVIRARRRASAAQCSSHTRTGWMLEENDAEVDEGHDNLDELVAHGGGEHVQLLGALRLRVVGKRRVMAALVQVDGRVAVEHGIARFGVDVNVAGVLRKGRG